ncbi:Transcription initiation factor TFIID subunit 9 [Cryptotermes secundus]|uniref:Transcription initiation factor TFIID subunit 9 n=2 Tax=Cryptotermes secundus TaxID=105785 RepID=A0A2J7PE43_9NEOP|nr:Transcription initiation factor TFIID subunit 9 [Cryptotermes secundus]
MQVKHIPKDAQVIMSIMKDMGIEEYEPRVINQLLEFTYRYITCILDDARVFANHAKKKVIDLEDVKLAVQMTVDRAFTTPPPRDILLEVARTKNNSPLPLIKPHCGLRLPPDRYCLSSCNYRLKNNKKPQTKQVHHHMMSGGNAGYMNNAVTSHLTHGALSAAGVKLHNKQPQSLSLVKRQGTLATVARTQTITIPKPVIKFSSATPASKPIAKPKIQVSAPTGNVLNTPMKVEVNDVSSGLKRKLDEEYDMLE